MGERLSKFQTSFVPAMSMQSMWVSVCHQMVISKYEEEKMLKCIKGHFQLDLPTYETPIKNSVIPFMLF